MIQNRFYYGMVEEHTQEKIKEFLKGKGDGAKQIAFLRWPLPFEKFSLEDLDKSSIKMPIVLPATEKKSKAKKDAQGDVFETTDIQKLLAENEKQRFIVIENIHILAHGEENPELFYKKLLTACNYYTKQIGIRFILSCARIPAVFVKENALIHQWVFEKCDCGLEPSESDRFNYLRKVYGKQLLTHHFKKINKVLYDDRTGDEIDKNNFIHLPKEEKINRQITGIIESMMEFDSQLYLKEEQPEDEISIEDVKNIKEKLERLIFGQDEAIQRVVDVALMFYGARKNDDNKPRQKFLFVGPSGVGKTELCRQLVEVLPGYKFLQINLAEHHDEHAIDKLLGVGRGFKDSEAGGILTEPVRRYPKHIILFDELDHAHKSVLHLFYKIFEGDIQDGRGRTISFRDCFIFMTTNKGTVFEDEDIPLAERRRAIEKKLIEDGKEITEGSSRLTFNEPFLGRINWIVQFNELGPSDLVSIAESYFKKRVIDFYRVEPWQVKVCFEPTVKPKLLSQNILKSDFLFYEIWALMAYQLREQGARRLYQYMDELLIYPLEHFRINYEKDFFKPGHQIKINFQPYLPDIAGSSYDRASLLLIDDDEEEAILLKELLKGVPIDVEWADFENGRIIEKASSATTILLDLLKDGKNVGIKVLEKLQKSHVKSPISAYTSMPAGPELDKLKASLWQFKISQYINKKQETDEEKDSKKRAVSKDIQDAYLMKKSREGKEIKTASLQPPLIMMNGAREIIFTLSY